PSGLRLGDNDTRILSVAANLSAEGHDVTVVSKDLPMRVKASAVGLNAEEYRAQQVVDSGYTGMTTAELTESEMADLWGAEPLVVADLATPGALADTPRHTGVVLHSPRGSALATTAAGG